MRLDVLTVDSNFRDMTCVAEMDDQIYVVSHGGVFDYALFIEWIYRVMCSGGQSKVALDRAIIPEQRSMMTYEAVDKLNEKSDDPNEIIEVINSFKEVYVISS